MAAIALTCVPQRNVQNINTSFWLYVTSDLLCLAFVFEAQSVRNTSGKDKDKGLRQCESESPPTESMLLKA